MRGLQSNLPLKKLILEAHSGNIHQWQDAAVQQQLTGSLKDPIDGDNVLGEYSYFSQMAFLFVLISLKIYQVCRELEAKLLHHSSMQNITWSPQWHNSQNKE